MKTTPPFISEVVREYNEYVISIFDSYDPNVSDYMRDEFLREKLTAVYERGRQEGREEGVKSVVRELKRIETNAYPQEPVFGEVRAVANEALLELTTEGK